MIYTAIDLRWIITPIIVAFLVFCWRTGRREIRNPDMDVRLRDLPDVEWLPLQPLDKEPWKRPENWR